MRYLVILKAAQPDTPPPAELMEAIAKLGMDATNAGVMLDMGGLAPTVDSARIDVTAGGLSVVDGPFAEAKELISYVVYDVRSKAEAVEWAGRFMRLHRDLWEGWEGEAEVSRVFGPEDFAPQG
ncbi:YciI family protein [Micromonospora sp. NPDC005252]|uniref:YciI family protein n=1 Tax=unclassified Micromonospora TaxID=2617518 RepID=UPI0033AD579E